MKAIILFVGLVLSFSLKGQLCGTPSPTPQDLEVINRIQSQISTNKNARVVASGTLWVPLKIHILRKSDGSGEIDLGAINEAIAYANRLFLPSGLQFFIGGNTANYINDDILYNTQYVSYPKSSNDAAEYPLSISTNESNNALNMYFVPNIIGVGGYAHFPSEGDSKQSTRIFINTNALNGGVPTPFMSYTVAHELGHIFGLLHTFDSDLYGKEPVDRTTTNCSPKPNPNNSNCCNITGDLICDTDADPYDKDKTFNIFWKFYGDGGVPVFKNGCGLTYVGFAGYSPPLDNMMSYYYGYFQNEKCTHFKFTNEQNTRILIYYSVRIARINTNLSFSPTSQTPPTISSITPTNTPKTGIKLTWQDNSSVETGYFIERASSSAGPFTCIGGVAPNITTYIDDESSNLSSTAYYRIRASNAQSYSAVASVGVQSKIVADTIRFSQIYPSVSFPVTFNIFGNFTTSTTFTVQLSDQNGSFTTPINIGTGTASPILATLPMQIFQKGNYRIRIISTSPVASGDASGTFSILTFPTGTTYPISQVEYKIDNQSFTVLGISSTNSATINIPVSTTGLLQGLHTFTARVKNSNGSYSLTQDKMFMILGSGTASNNLITQAEFFIDGTIPYGYASPIALNTSDFAEKAINISTSNISVGVHVLYIRAKSATGLWSITQAFPFVKIPTSGSQIIAMEYFFDNDPGVGNGNSIAITSGITIIQNIASNINPLSKGVHTLNVRVKDSSNHWSLLSQKTFDVQKSPCLTIQTITSPISSSPEIVQAATQIIATNAIYSSNLLYRAGQSMTLLPGFTTNNGSVFTAFIEGCK